MTRTLRALAAGIAGLAATAAGLGLSVTDAALAGIRWADVPGFTTLGLALLVLAYRLAFRGRRRRVQLLAVPVARSRRERRPDERARLACRRRRRRSRPLPHRNRPDRLGTNRRARPLDGAEELLAPPAPACRSARSSRRRRRIDERRPPAHVRSPGRSRGRSLVTLRLAAAISREAEPAPLADVVYGSGARAPHRIPPVGERRIDEVYRGGSAPVRASVRPDAGHTEALAAHPSAYAARIRAFFRSALVTG